MTNLKLSSKMHIFIIISAAIIAVGLAMGLIFQFVSNGYFNYGAENSNYQTVVVDYAIVDFNDKDKVVELCDEEFKEADLSYYTSTFGATSMGGQITFMFTEGVSAEKLQSVADAINAKITDGDLTVPSNASYHSGNTYIGNTNAFVYGAIAISAAVVFQFVYFAVRYKLTMAFAALLADVHNLAVYISLLAITRVPLGAAAAAFGALTVLITMIGCCFFFDRMRKYSKDEKTASLGAFEQVDLCAGESIVNISVSSVSIALIAAVILVLLSISALSVQLLVTPVVLALISAVAGIYGTAFFTPSVYSRFKLLGDEYKAKHSKKSKNS